MTASGTVPVFGLTVVVRRLEGGIARLVRGAGFGIGFDAASSSLLEASSVRTRNGPTALLPFADFDAGTAEPDAGGFGGDTRGVGGDGFAVPSGCCLGTGGSVLGAGAEVDAMPEDVSEIVPPAAAFTMFTSFSAVKFSSTGFKCSSRLRPLTTVLSTTAPASEIVAPPKLSENAMRSSTFVALLLLSTTASFLTSRCN